MISRIPFGNWPSPVSAEMLSSAGVRVGGVASHNGIIYWSEARPDEGGRVVLVCKHPDKNSQRDVFGPDWGARTRVHEYGGGAWWLGAAHLYFTNWSDQRLYRVALEPGSEPRALTTEPEQKHAYRYADGCESVDGCWIVCVRERHNDASDDVINELVVIPTDGSAAIDASAAQTVASGADFYSTPRLSGDGQSLSWIQWMHPQMPWDGTELCVAAIDENGVVAQMEIIAGGTEVSIVGADWASVNELVYSSDQSGWWNLFSFDTQSRAIQQLTDLRDAEIGAPAWVFGAQRFVKLQDNSELQANPRKRESDRKMRLAVIVTHQARDELAVLDSSGKLTGIHTPYSCITGIAAHSIGSVVLCGQAAGSMTSINVVACEPSVHPVKPLPVTTAALLPFHDDWLSTPEAITFKSAGRDSHAFFYPPAGSDVDGVADELPPLVVMGHGGPTSHSTDGLRLSIQFWTSRGIAVVDVNYAGSSGFGRAYRRELNLQWGIVDVEDCIAAAEHLATTGRVDAKRLVIRGGSAGGLTVLRALQTSDSFAGGTSLYGVSDLESLAADTHKFESRYLDGLIGRYPQDKQVYQQRSPINHTEQLNTPLLVLQGDQDEVVPPVQSSAIVDAVAKKGLPHAYVLFEGEQHGFRRAENIIRAQQLELWFYGKVLGFEPADQIEPPVEAVGFA